VFGKLLCHWISIITLIVQIYIGHWIAVNNSFISMNKHLKTVFFILFSLPGLLTSCKKEDNQLVKVTTDPVSQISRTSGSFKGSIINEGTDTVIAYGFCWSTKSQPDYGDNRSIPYYMTKGTFQSGIENLSPGTTYYVRAYAITVENKIYGNQESFTTKPATALTTFNPQLTYKTVSDIDGNIYKTIKIGTQEWLAENLKTSRLNDGTAIPLITDDIIWAALNTPGYCWYNNDEAVFKNIYGGYYNWYAVNSGKLCPAGWHVPDDNDWKVFKLFLGMPPELIETADFSTTTYGNKIKETGTINWVEGNADATNESGFTALPGGDRFAKPETFGAEGLAAGWWSASSINYSGNYAFSHWVIFNVDWFYRTGNLSTTYGLNVRCIKD
jgi:uncharacterized protein (TIGR02145 family)